MALLDKGDLIDRARVQLALWRREHGDNLEPLLDRTIVGMRDTLARLSDALKPWETAGDHNRTAGNRNRTAAGVRLHFAVEEAVAWTAEPVSHRDEKRSDPGDCGITSARENERNAITDALEWVGAPKPEDGELPTPEHQFEHAFTRGNLFMALRFAFLQDNEMLPRKLRNVVDAMTGKHIMVKTHDKAARTRGAPFSFLELWTALEEERYHKAGAIPENATYAARSVAYQLDYEMKREAKALRDRPPGTIPPDAMLAMSVLNRAVWRGFLAP